MKRSRQQRRLFDELELLLRRGWRRWDAQILTFLLTCPLLAHPAAGRCGRVLLKRR